MSRKNKIGVQRFTDIKGNSNPAKNDGSQWGYVSPVTKIAKAQSEKYRIRKK